MCVWRSLYLVHRCLICFHNTSRLSLAPLVPVRSRFSLQPFFNLNINKRNLKPNAAVCVGLQHLLLLFVYVAFQAEIETKQGISMNPVIKKWWNDLSFFRILKLLWNLSIVTCSWDYESMRLQWMARKGEINDWRNPASDTSFTGRSRHEILNYHCEFKTERWNNYTWTWINHL